MKILAAQGFMPDVIEAIEKLQAKIYRYSGRRGVTRISVDSEFGINHGLTPGTTAILWTSCGPVELFCERRLDLEYDPAPVTCGYEPCDGGPCLRPEAHAAREAAIDEDE